MAENVKMDIWRMGSDILRIGSLCHRYPGYVWHSNVL